jgi:hypothetical protein
VAEHVANTLVFGVQGLGKVRECRGEFARRTTELLEQLLGEKRIGCIDAHPVGRIGSMDELVMVLPY